MCCGRDRQPRAGATSRDQAARDTATGSRAGGAGAVTYRVVPPTAAPVDGLASYEDAVKVRDRLGGEIKRVVR